MRIAPHATPFVGRAVELSSLRSLLDHAAGGAGQVALIEGEGGVGKTRLLDETLEYAEKKGLRVFRGTADELERDRPFGAVADALRLDPQSEDLELAEIGRMLASKDEPPEEGSSPGQAVDLGFRIVDSIVSVVETLAANSPVALAFEDLHWTDPSTLRTIRLLGRRIPRLPVALFLTLRPHPRVPDLDRVIERILDEGGRHLVLGPLDDLQAADLASQILGAELGPRLLRQVASAGGNPLFVLELIRTLREEKAIELRDAHAEVDEISLPPSLRLTLVRRLSFLRDETLEVLKIASVLGSSFTVEDLSTVTDRSVTELLTHLTDAVRAGILGDVGDRLSFRHDLIREAIYEDIPAAARKQLHQHVGKTLAAGGAPLARVAPHLSLGASRGDAETVSWLHRAGLEAAPRSAPIAVELLERALELTDARAPARSRLSADLVVSLISVGRLADAVALARETVALERDPMATLRLRRSLAAALFWGGDRRMASDLIELNIAAPELPEWDRATDLALAAPGRLYQGDLNGARVRAEEALSAGERLGNRTALVVAHSALSIIERFRGSLTPALHHSSRAVEAAAYAEDPVITFVLSPTYSLGLALIEADRLDESRDALASARRATEEVGVAWQLPFFDLSLAINNFLAGRWDDAIAEAEGGLALLQESESTFATLISLQSLLAVMALHRGDLEQAESAVAAAEVEMARTGPQLGVDIMFWARALVLQTNGNLEGALSMLGNMWSLSKSFGYYPAHRLAGLDLVRMALEVGDTERAGAVTTDLEELAERAGVPTAQGAALLCRGLLESEPEVLLRSVETYRRGPRPFERALACEATAGVLAHHGRLEDGVPLFTEALEIYEELGARRDADRVDASLRSFGVRRRRRRSTRKAAWGWESLTETELRVVRLISEGLTNRQIGERLFISRRTVETHVSHVFRKVGLSTRVELAAEVVRRMS